MTCTDGPLLLAQLLAGWHQGRLCTAPGACGLAGSLARECVRALAFMI
jgi:hypothetical protein